MSDDAPLSALRRVLCSHANAVRLARWLRRDGIDTAIEATGDPLQPWRLVEAAAIAHEDVRACV